MLCSMFPALITRHPVTGESREHFSDVDVGCQNQRERYDLFLSPKGFQSTIISLLRVFYDVFVYFHSLISTISPSLKVSLPRVLR